MKLDTFFDNFGLLIDAPNGVQKLREMILQLAVQGKLVPQNPKDEPASVLLEKIKAEKERLIKDKKIKKSKTLPPIKPDEIFYELQDSWEWVRLRTACHDLGQKKPDKKFTYIDVTSIDKEKGVVSDEVKLLEAEEAPSRARKIVEKGTVIYSTVRPYLLNIAIIDHHFDPEPIVSTAFAVLNPFRGIYNRYIYYYLRSKPFIEYVEDAMTGMAYPAINDGKMNIGLIPIPPTNEQKRIVAKIDELMALCDELEARKQQVSKNCIQLNDASIHKLLTARESKKFGKHWQRICNNFDLLYSKPENVTKLRQAILQLAVQGKLVPQDPNDEPASVLLEKIKAEKERFIKEKKIKKPKPLPPINHDEIPYAIPDGWEWCRFPEIGEFGRGKSKHRPRNAPELYIDGTIPLVQTGDVARSNGIINAFTGLYNENGLVQSKLWKKGTMCITIAANIADSGILGFDACFPDSVVGFVPSDEIGDAKYFEYFMRTAKSHLTVFAPSTAQKNINLGILQSVLIPLPPAPEIKRIVAKVDELLALCDELEATLSKSQTDCDMLMEAAVTEILAA